MINWWGKNYQRRNSDILGRFVQSTGRWSKPAGQGQRMKREYCGYGEGEKPEQAYHEGIRKNQAEELSAQREAKAERGN